MHGDFSEFLRDWSEVFDASMRNRYGTAVRDREGMFETFRKTKAVDRFVAITVPLAMFAGLLVGMPSPLPITCVGLATCYVVGRIAYVECKAAKKRIAPLLVSGSFDSRCPGTFIEIEAEQEQWSDDTCWTIQSREEGEPVDNALLPIASSFSA